MNHMNSKTGRCLVSGNLCKMDEANSERGNGNLASKHRMLATVSANRGSKFPSICWSRLAKGQFPPKPACHSIHFMYWLLRCLPRSSRLGPTVNQFHTASHAKYLKRTVPHGFATMEGVIPQQINGFPAESFGKYRYSKIWMACQSFCHVAEILQHFSQQKTMLHGGSR